MLKDKFDFLLENTIKRRNSKIWTQKFDFILKSAISLLLSKITN